MSVVEGATVMVLDRHQSLSAPMLDGCKLVAVLDGFVLDCSGG
jgi:hypothetical protein